MSKSTSKAPSDRSKLTKRILIGVGITLVLVYIVFLFITTNFLGNNNIVTETANKAKAYDIVESKSLIVRNEEYLSSGTSGVMVYDVSDGDKVTSDGVVATAYNSQDDVTAVQQRKELDERIAYLKSLNEVNNSTNVGIDTLNSQINERMVAVMKSINACDYSNIDSAEQNLLTSILRKQLLTGDQKNFDDKIAELESQRASLKNAQLPASKLSSSPQSSIKRTAFLSSSFLTSVCGSLAK